MESIWKETQHDEGEDLYGEPATIKPEGGNPGDTNDEAEDTTLSVDIEKVIVFLRLVIVVI